MVDRHAPAEMTGYDADKGQTIPVGGIHVSLNFENESGKLFFRRLYNAVGRTPRRGLRSEAQEFL